MKRYSGQGLKQKNFSLFMELAWDLAWWHTEAFWFPKHGRSSGGKKELKKRPKGCSRDFS